MAHAQRETTKHQRQEGSGAWGGGRWRALGARLDAAAPRSAPLHTRPRWPKWGENDIVRHPKQGIKVMLCLLPRRGVSWFLYKNHTRNQARNHFIEKPFSVSMLSEVIF